VQLGVVTEALSRTWYERNTGRAVTLCSAWIALWWAIVRMGTPAGSPVVDWSLETVAISDPPASRSDTRTVVWALDARMQSGVPTKVFLSLAGGAMQSNGGEVLIGADVSKAWIDVCQSETARVDRIVNTPEALAAWLAQ